MEPIVLQHTLSTDDKPTVVQGTTVASPYDHHTKDSAAPVQNRDEGEGSGVGAKQVSLFLQLPSLFHAFALYIYG